MFDRLMNYSALLRKAGRTTRASTLLTKALGLLGNCENIDKGTHIALITVSAVNSPNAVQYWMRPVCKS